MGVAHHCRAGNSSRAAVTGLGMQVEGVWPAIMLLRTAEGCDLAQTTPNRRKTEPPGPQRCWGELQGALRLGMPAAGVRWGVPGRVTGARGQLPSADSAPPRACCCSDGVKRVPKPTAPASCAWCGLCCPPCPSCRTYRGVGASASSTLSLGPRPLFRTAPLSASMAAAALEALSNLT